MAWPCDSVIISIPINMRERRVLEPGNDTYRRDKSSQRTA